MRIPIEALELVRFCSQDEYRANLNNLLIRRTPEGYAAFATSGIMLGAHYWSCAGDKIFEREFCIKGQDIRDWLKLRKKGDRLLGEDYDAFDRIMDCNFPDVDAVIPKQNKGKKQDICFAVDVHLLADIAKYYKTVNYSGGVTKMTMVNPLAPILIEPRSNQSAGSRTIFVVMPCNV